MTWPPVELVGSSPSGLAEFLAGVLEQHLARDPARAAHLVRSVVVLDVPDADVAITVRLAPTGVRVVDGAAPDAHLWVRADAHRLLALAGVPLRFGVPDPARAEGRSALAEVALGRIRVRGLVRHPIRMTRFLSLLSVHEAP